MDHKEYIRTSLEQQQRPASKIRDELALPAYVCENICNGAVAFAVDEALDDFKKRFANWLADEGYPRTANALRDGSWEKP